MDKAQLIDILHHYSSTSPQEAEELVLLREAYPYSQVLQALAARVSKDHNFNNQQQILQSAAVYSTDRAVLKEIITKPYSAPIQAVQSKDYEVNEILVANDDSVHQTIDSIDYADELLLDLKRLSELKLQYENVVASLDHTAEPLIEKPARRPPGRPKKKVDAEADPLIEEISSKKKIDPESPTTKEQIAIIDQFIKAQPNIASKVKANDSHTSSDLAGDLKSGEFSDSIVSETLAEILVRQGKKEKAIEVYRKLIWKFPQKKTYFAAQIEELKK